jgi:hypothetical protein
MAENQEQYSENEEINNMITRLIQVSPGHKTKEGNLDPTKVDKEVRNKLSGVNSLFDSLSYPKDPRHKSKEFLDQFVRDGVRAVLDIYPEKRLLVKSLIEDPKSNHIYGNLSQQIDWEDPSKPLNENN